MHNWGEIDGRLVLHGSPGLSFTMPLHRALNIMYAAWVEYLTGDQRDALDEVLSVTAEGLPEYERKQQQKRIDAVMLGGGDIGG